MRILIVSMNAASWGGSEDLWKSVATHALKEGHEVMISVFRHPSLNPNIKELQSHGAVIHQRPLPSFYRSQHFLKRALAEISQQMKADETLLDWIGVYRWKPEVILFSSGETFDYLLHDQSYLVRYCQGRSIRFFMISQRNWDWGLDVSNEFRESRRKLIDQCSGVFFVSFHNYKMACMQLAMEIPRARMVQNPLKIDLCQVISFPDHQVPHLAYVARLETVIKGQDLFLEAISSKRIREIPFKVRFFGAGPDHAYLKDLIAFRKLNSKVELWGHEVAIEKVWAQHQLLVLFSLTEGCPLALKEAMACGRSALVTPAGDSGLWASETGFVSRSLQVSDMEESVFQALENKNHWKTLGERSREKVVNHHRPDDPLEILQCLLQTRTIHQTGLSPEEYIGRFS